MTELLGKFPIMREKTFQLTHRWLRWTKYDELYCVGWNSPCFGTWHHDMMCNFVFSWHGLVQHSLESARKCILRPTASSWCAACIAVKDAVNGLTVMGGLSLAPPPSGHSNPSEPTGLQEWVEVWNRVQGLLCAYSRVCCLKTTTTMFILLMGHWA